MTSRVKLFAIFTVAVVSFAFVMISLSLFGLLFEPDAWIEDDQQDVGEQRPDHRHQAQEQQEGAGKVDVLRQERLEQ